MSVSTTHSPKLARRRLCNLESACTNRRPRPRISGRYSKGRSSTSSHLRGLRRRFKRRRGGAAIHPLSRGLLLLGGEKG